MTEMNGIARRDLERLSAFLDGELSPGEAEQLEARLATDQRLNETLKALQATSNIIGTLPEVDIPHSFALTPEMVRPRRAYPILQLTTAMAALGFVLVVGADLLLSNAASNSSQAPGQAFFAADLLAEQEIPAAEDAAPAAAPAFEEAVVEEAEGVLPEAEFGSDAEDGFAQDLFRSDEDATSGEPADESAAAPVDVGESELAGEGTVDQEAASTLDSADQEALKAASEADPLEGRLAATDLDSPEEAPSTALNMLRLIEIGLAVALIVLIGLTLWVRQRG